MIGGPMKYEGPDLYVAHASMHIDDMCAGFELKLGRGDMCMLLVVPQF